MVGDIDKTVLKEYYCGLTEPTGGDKFGLADNPSNYYLLLVVSGS